MLMIYGLLGSQWPEILHVKVVHTDFHLDAGLVTTLDLPRLNSLTVPAPNVLWPKAPNKPHGDFIIKNTVPMPTF